MVGGGGGGGGFGGPLARSPWLRPRARVRRLGGYFHEWIYPNPSNALKKPFGLGKSML